MEKIKISITNKYQYYCLFFYLAVWIFLAINPKDRFIWFLENLLPLVFVSLLIATYKRFRFSKLSYTLITAFMVMHAIGAHYSYSEVPFFKSMFELIHFQRDNYDRLVHFSFGLLMAYPIREFIVKKAKITGFWSYYIPAAIIMSFSAAYEMIEWAAAKTVASPKNALAFLGMQGDVFDAEKDMLMAASGAVITMFISFANRARHTK